jgi:hypothetical protein
MINQIYEETFIMEPHSVNQRQVHKAPGSDGREPFPVFFIKDRRIQILVFRIGNEWSGYENPVITGKGPGKKFDPALGKKAVLVQRRA